MTAATTPSLASHDLASQDFASQDFASQDFASQDFASSTIGTRDLGRRMIVASDLVRRALLVLGATLLTLASTIPVVRTVLAGVFSDPDDAMRLVEVRAYLAGQAWFDVSAHRLDPPFGASMHWSRLVDVPNAVLIRSFELFTGAANAEALDRVVLPSLYLVLLFWGMTRLARVLFGVRAEAVAVVGTVCSGATLVLFQPGRIGHHAPDTVYLVFALGAALASLDAARSRQATIAGGLVALSLGTSLETLPFLGTLGAAMVLVWVWRGAAFAAGLRWFAIGLGAALPVVFAIITPSGAWFAPVCDAFGMAHLGAGLIAAVSCLLLAGPGSRLRTRMQRLAAAVALGAVALAYLVLAYPACLHGPFAGVDPLVRANWLDHVVESLSLPAFLGVHPALGLAMACPVALGCGAMAVASLRERGIARERCLIVAALAVVGLALAFWQVRVFTSTMPIALCGGVYAVTCFADWLRAGGLGIAARIAGVAILPFTATAWAIALPEEAAPSTRVSCLTPDALAPLRSLPPGRLLAPINEGSHLLEATSHTVFAAPYHRNNDGNRFALDVLSAPAITARALLKARGVAYVALCAGDGETTRLAAQAPEGLAADLAEGRTPAYLRRMPLAPTPFAVFAVQPDR